MARAPACLVERFETRAKFEPYVEAVVEQFLLGQVPYKGMDQRGLNNWIKKGHAELSAQPSSKRAAETSPSNSNITEGFRVVT